MNTSKSEKLAAQHHRQKGFFILPHGKRILHRFPVGADRDKKDAELCSASFLSLPILRKSAKIFFPCGRMKKIFRR